jgi:hypothetical protein
LLQSFGRVRNAARQIRVLCWSEDFERIYVEQVWIGEAKVLLLQGRSEKGRRQELLAVTRLGRANADQMVRARSGRCREKS